MEESLDNRKQPLPFLCHFIDHVNPTEPKICADFGNFLRSIKLDSLGANTVLILTNFSDVDSTILGIFLARNGIDYTRLNQEDFLNNVTVGLTLCDDEYSCKMDVNGNGMDLDKVSLVFKRDFNLENCNFASSSFIQKFTFQEWNNFLNFMVNRLTCPWINSIKSIGQSDDRFMVMQLAKQIGFSVPDTIITNDTESIKKFYIKHDGQIISKVLSHHNIASNGNIYSVYSHNVSREDLNLLEYSQISPCIFQKRIEHKKEIRITIIGEDIFATELDLTDQLLPIDDIHRLGVDKIKKYAISLSNDYEKKCFDLIKSLDLSYGTIDLLVGSDQEYYFLEVNSIGDWYWIEKDTKQTITQSIVNTIKRNIQT